MDGVLNEHTRTVHKHELGTTDLTTVCGITHTVDPGRLETVPVEETASNDTVTKCGRCFDDYGGY